MFSHQVLQFFSDNASILVLLLEVISVPENQDLNPKEENHLQNQYTKDPADGLNRGIAQIEEIAYFWTSFLAEAQMGIVPEEDNKRPAE